MREDWIETEIGDVAKLYQPKTISSKMLVADGKYDVYGANGIIGKYDKFNHEEEEFLITCRGATCGNVHITKPFSWINGNAMVVKPFDQELLSLEYLKFVFSNKGRIQKAISGSAQPQITRSTLSLIKIPIAPLPEQRAIVGKIEELFSDLDKGIADLKQAQNQLKVYRQAVLKKAFEGEYSEDATIELNRIGEHCKIVSGKAFKKSEYSDSGVRLFQIANVSFNKIVWDKIAHLPKSYLSDEKLKTLVLKEGDLVMALNRPMLNNELKIGILGKSDVPSILYQRVGKFVFDSNINSKYLGYFLQSPVFIKWLSKELQGVNIPFINQSNLLGFSEFPYVDIELQNQIVRKIESRLSVCDKVEESITESLEKAKALRQSILKKAFEGTLLSEAEIAACKAAKDYEPASILLKKIKAEKKK